jgi:hypothetical protein
MPILDEGVVEVTAEAFLHVGNILHLHDIRGHQNDSIKRSSS